MNDQQQLENSEWMLVCKIKRFIEQRDLYWFYGFMVALNELIVSCVNIKLGIALHLLLLAALITHSCLTFKLGAPLMYLALTVAPFIRLLSLSMPLENIPIILWYEVIGVPLLAVAIYIVKLTGLKKSEIGFTLKNLPLQLLISLLGIPLGLAEYAILRQDLLPINFKTVLLPIIILICCTGFLEEFIFRGIIYNSALKVMSSRNALFYANFIYAALHITQQSLWNVIYAFIVGIIFTKIYAWQKSIVGISIAHGIINITLYIICPSFL